jgi:protein CpxP
MKRILSLCCLFIGIAALSHAQTKKMDVTTDPVKKAKGLQKELMLSDKQTEKIAEIYKESSSKFDKIKAEQHGNTNKMVTAIAPLRTATIKKIKAVLTPKQAVKYDKLIKNSGSTGNNGWSDGWSSTPDEN